MALSREEVAALGRLARIELSPEELEHLAPQLDQILEHVAQVSRVAAADIQPTSHPLPLTNVFRPDVVVACLPVEAALSGGPSVEDNKFRVPRILGEGA
ncbi:MAG: Asp-tRNA(Asn)/Glu-tRNA(Gln) amidotransferase subunit GatC [Microlunatus sp.]|nr:Asp-tRNA(Asn)/Glu-tRNA(Gln) amidotransferase subunit GatC [Microlunatus sp.]